MAKHARKENRGKLRLSDLRFRNLHPVAKRNLFLYVVIVFFVVFMEFRLLSTMPWYHIGATVSLQQFSANAQVIMTIAGGVAVIAIGFYLMFKDTPITPNAKANWALSHADKSKQACKIIDVIGNAISAKGGGGIATQLQEAVDGYIKA